MWNRQREAEEAREKLLHADADALAAVVPVKPASEPAIETTPKEIHRHID